MKKTGFLKSITVTFSPVTNPFYVFVFCICKICGTCLTARHLGGRGRIIRTSRSSLAGLSCSSLVESLPRP